MTSVEIVKAICRERKIPISQLERECGFANGYISQLRKGVFPDDRIRIIASFFGVSVTSLMGDPFPRSSGAGSGEKGCGISCAPIEVDVRTERFSELFSRLTDEQKDLILAQLEGIAAKL